MKKVLIPTLKYGVSAAILAYLVWQAQRDDAFDRLANQPKQWEMLVLGWAACMAAVVITFVRWMLLVRALRLPFRMQDAFRLGFLGYLFNFVSLGSVGGDLFKVVFLAREHRENKTHAVTSVLMDRMIGLYGLFLVAAAAILLTGWWTSPITEIRVICRAALVGAVLGTLAVVILFLPGFGEGPFARRLRKLHYSGKFFHKLIEAAQIYRTRSGVLIVALLMSLLIHSFTATGIYFYSRGLPGNSPSLTDQFVISPLAVVTGALPLPLSGLGAFEYVLDFLFMHMASVPEKQGFLVAIAYRVGTIAIAMVGVGYYLTCRREVDAAMHEAEDEAQRESGDDTRPNEFARRRRPQVELNAES